MPKRQRARRKLRRRRRDRRRREWKRNGGRDHANQKQPRTQSHATPSGGCHSSASLTPPRPGVRLVLALDDRFSEHARESRGWLPRCLHRPLRGSVWGTPPGLRVPAGDPPDPGSCGGPRDPGSCGGPARSGFLLGTRQIRVSPHSGPAQMVNSYSPGYCTVFSTLAAAAPSSEDLTGFRPLGYARGRGDSAVRPGPGRAASGASSGVPVIINPVRTSHKNIQRCGSAPRGARSSICVAASTARRN
jgi:hypothetical protein